MSAKSLKDRNRWPLLLTMLANVAAFYVAVKTGELTAKGINEIVKDWHVLIPVGASFALTSIFNELLDSDNKARLVFLRWNDPLPGSRAFTVYAHMDSRIDASALERKLGKLPTSPHDQNSLWYRLYRSVSDDPSVIQVHRQYLFTRDYATAAFVFLVILGPLGIWWIPTTYTAFLYIALLLLQFVLARQAAKNHGIRFVTTVLAIKAAE